MSMSQFALRWILMFDAVSCAIPGAKNPAQVEENALAADRGRLSSKTMRTAQEVYGQRIRGLVHHYW
jgi:aryl-alcohol dehydrogenase-like predicted oxidoreductase